LKTELQSFVKKVFLDRKNVNTQQQKIQNNQTLKHLPEPGIKLGASRTQRGYVTTAPPSQMRLAFVVRLSNCLDANVNKQGLICGSQILFL